MSLWDYDQVARRDPTRTDSCESHGQFEATEFPPGRWSTCPTCFEESEKRRQAEEAEQRRIKKIQDFKDGSGCEPIYTHATLEGFSAPVMKQASAWLELAVNRESEGPLVLVGPVGVGKTHLASALLLSAIERSVRPGLYITAAGYCRSIRSTWSKRGSEDSDSESDLLDRHRNANWLVLDDLGAGRSNDVDLVQDLICERYAAGLMYRTIVVSNFAAPQFNAAFGERVADRIRHGATLVALAGPSRRKVTS